MRDVRHWKTELLSTLSSSWKQEWSQSPSTFLDVELGLFLLEQVFETPDVEGLSALMSGYSFPTPEVQTLSANDRAAIGVARYLLRRFASRYHWKRQLSLYRELPESVRGYDFADERRFAQHNVAVATSRWDAYDSALSEPAPLSQTDVNWAEAGQYYYDEDGLRVDVEIPEWIDEQFVEPTGHCLEARPHQPISVSMDELMDTARWMDEQSNGVSSYEKRLDRVRFESLSDEGKLVKSDSLKVDGILHLAGMVSSGKSTLMDVLAVWAARNDRHITIVVGDVVSALIKAAMFVDLGLMAAPVLGSSDKPRHLKLLNRAIGADATLHPFDRTHSALRWVSTINPLLAYRRSGDGSPVPSPLDVTLKAATDRSRHAKRHFSPFYSHAPINNAQRDLVDAQIWVATIPSLVCTRVDPQLNREAIRFCELVYRTSDLVIFDEADQVQLRLDDLFNPTETLIARGTGGWLNRLSTRVTEKRNERGLEQFANAAASDWHSAVDNSLTAMNRIYSLILRDTSLQQWIGNRNYFSNRLLFHQLGKQLWPDEDQLPRFVDEFLDDPLGAEKRTDLVDLANRSLTLNNEDLLLEEIEEWLDANAQPEIQSPSQDKAARRQLIARFRFGLMVSVLQHQLNRVIVNWDAGAAEFELDNSESLFFSRPPRDYEPVIPTAPMGNVLAFQYVKSDSDDPGVLRFFRCMGLGRWILLHFNELFDPSKQSGPNTLLLSGTSWAGDSPSCHLQELPEGVLRAPDEEIDAIAQSQFTFLPLSETGTEPIRVSGKQGEERRAALGSLVRRLVRKHDLTGKSILESERDQLKINRQRTLLLVGSYDEALDAQETIVRERPDLKDSVFRLVRDDDETNREQTLPRGMVHTFATTDAWILIAPLLAVERGHNILNDEKKAAFGAAYFLVQPHPRPDDASFAIQSISRWAIDNIVNYGDTDTATAAGKFRKDAFAQWQRLLRLPLRRSSLPRQERHAVTWNILVVLWQVIGRLVRGGEAAHVFFCDAAFGPRTASGDERSDDAISSQLIEMRQLLAPYFEDETSVSSAEREIVRTLYFPMYRALTQIANLPDPQRIDSSRYNDQQPAM